MAVHKKILIVDNNADFRKEFSQKLLKTGYQVFQAVGGEAAFEILEDFKMDLIFLGQSIAGYSQEMFLQKLRRTFSGQVVPVLVIPPPKEKGGGALPQDKWVECLKTWPMNLDDLLVRIDKLINKFHSSPRSATQKVLIAGIESDVVENMVQQLRKREYEAQSAFSGSQTITKAVQMRPDILIMDVLIEDVSALEVINVLRKMPEFGKKPIVLYCYYRLTDLDREDVRERVLSVEAAVMNCKEAGADEYIGRYNENAFLAFINKYLF